MRSEHGLNWLAQNGSKCIHLYGVVRVCAVMVSWKVGHPCCTHCVLGADNNQTSSSKSNGWFAPVLHLTTNNLVLQLCDRQPSETETHCVIVLTPSTKLLKMYHCLLSFCLETPPHLLGSVGGTPSLNKSLEISVLWNTLIYVAYSVLSVKEG